MGRMKTEQERMEKQLGALKGQKMAEAFAAHRTHEFLEAFLKDTGLEDSLYESYLETKESDRETLTKDQLRLLLIQDYQLPFGRAIAMAYAMGYIDRHQNRDLKTLYVPGNLVEEKPDIKLHGLPNEEGK